MAPTSNKFTSSIAMAFAGRTESVDIPKPHDNFWAGKESFAAVTAKSLRGPNRDAGLPTPPNSLSPSLPPQLHKYRASSGNLTPPGQTQVDSDVDLDDAVEHAKAQDSPRRGLTARGLSTLADLDAVGNITSGLLAKHHLPGILLDNGPLAIRQMMGYLTTSVPGFSGIPPAKARRMVTGALESRGSDVIFEKVGWGRWDARKRGKPTREAREARETQNHSQPQASRTIRIPITSRRQDRSFGKATSQISDPDYDTSTEEHGLPEHEADRMSLDDSCSSYVPHPLKRVPDFDVDDETDEEDWASIGAAALREGSFALSGGLMPTNRRHQPHHDPWSRRGASGRPPAKMAKSMPSTTSIMYNRKSQQQQQATTAAHALMGFSPPPETGFGGDAEDRAAVEALLKLSSV